jgi:hypothetical protein
MFTRHRTGPRRAVDPVAQSFSERLAGSSLTRRTDPLHSEKADLRSRFRGAPTTGLRDRLGLERGFGLS